MKVLLLIQVPMRRRVEEAAKGGRRRRSRMCRHYGSYGALFAYGVPVACRKESIVDVLVREILN